MHDPSPRRPTLIVELNGEGHRFYLVRLLIEEALDQGRPVVLLTLSGPVVEEHRDEHLGSLVDKVELIEVPRRSWAIVEQTAREYDVEVTSIPEGDWCLPRITLRGGWRGPGRVRMLLMRAYPWHRQNPLRFVLAFSAKVISLVACTLFPRVRFFVLRSPLWQGRSIWPDARDPVGLECTPDDIARIRRDWGLGSDRYWFGVVGVLNTSKNIPLVADALCRLTGEQGADERRYGLLLAGKVADLIADSIPGVVARLERAGVRVVVVDRLLARDEFDAAISAVDCFVVAYSRDAPSGTFVKAVASGARVVAAGAKTLRDDAATVPDVASWTRLDPAALAEAFREASGRPRPEPAALGGEVEFARQLLG